MTNYDGTEYAFCDTENSFKLNRKRAFALEGDQCVVALGLVVDGICEFALAPFVCFNDFAVVRDELCELGNKCFCSFLGQIRVNNKKGFVRIDDPYGLQTVDRSFDGRETGL